jgi:cell division septation protein DedD
MMKQFVFSFLILVTARAFAQDLTATQVFPSSVAAGSSFTVEININRGSINGFMKFFQELPAGFVATEIDSKGGSFSFADNGAKVVWIAPPNEPTYTVSYKVTVPADASGTKNITAKFSYINNNERKIFDFEPKTITIGGTGSAIPPVSTSVATKQPPITEKQPVVVPPVKSTPTPPVAVEKPGSSAQVPAKPGNPATLPASTKTEAAAIPATKVPVTAVPSSTGKMYRVQIGAFSAKPKIDDVKDISTIVLDNGITKYFSGNFATIEEATRRKEEVAKKGFPGAFIVSFENGKIVK